MTAGAMSFELHYSAWNGRRGRCGCSLFAPAAYGRQGVIVLTEQEDNPGPSVTNAIEAIANELENLLRCPVLACYQLVEHYPANSLRGAAFSLVELSHDGRRFHNPRWRHLEEEQVEELVEGNDYQLRDVLRHWEPARAGAPTL